MIYVVQQKPIDNLQPKLILIQKDYYIIIKYSMDKIFDSQFYRGSVETNAEISKWNLKKVLFPESRFISDGDEFFKEIWKIIDSSKKYVWITTYAMDKSIVANTTISKLIQARKRGVNTVLFIDDLQQWVNKDLINEYILLGGIFSSLNPQWRIESMKKFYQKEIFRRHHQKILVSDNKGIIGSSNLEAAYADTKYGSRRFKDLNHYGQNLNVEQFREHIFRIAKLYNIQMSKEKSNEHLLQEYNKDFPNSQLNQSYYKFLYCHQPHVQQIQNQVIKQIQESKKSILLVHPYYYPIKKFQIEIQKALQRGVEIQLITSAKRDQPVYKIIRNALLLERLIEKGLKVYQLHQKLLHTKAYVIDEKMINIGSFNNDRWSWKINNEANINILSSQQYEKIKPYFSDLKKSCKNFTTLKKEYENMHKIVSRMRKFKMKFSEKFLYLSQCVMSKTKQFNFKQFWYSSPMNVPQ